MSTPVQMNVPKIVLIVEDQILLAMGLKDELEDGAIGFSIWPPVTRRP